jgi:hypothetical protein
MKADKPVGKNFAGDVTTAADKNGKPGKGKPSGGSSSSSSPSRTSAAQQRAEENGLCT